MEIRVRIDCPICKGEKKVDNPIYNEFINQLNAYQKENGPMTNYEVLNWLATSWKNPMPTPKLTCHICKGKGVIEKWIPIKELNRLLDIDIIGGR